ncbi:MAG: thymidine phosphorylase [Opitutaceae bacterium]
MGSATSPQEIIRKKRDGETFTRGDIENWIRGVVDGSFADYQSAALLMAIFQRGMSTDEIVWLTDAMMRSGEIIELQGISAPKVDKHSTGGVGDKVSLILAPLAAAAGLAVPMISGRGLGHTGGTLDKLESIPGFRVGVDIDEYRRQLAAIGIVLAGQTQTLVPADRILYALRDVTATVECIPLICASIMSKKLAEGIDALVLDVKFGRGAFMKSIEHARELARAMVSIGSAMRRPTAALLTSMDRPLGRAVGHSLEVIEAIECLQGRGPDDLMEVTMALTARMIVLGGLEPDVSKASIRLQRAIDSGDALRKFREVIEAQGGDPRVIDDFQRLPRARRTMDVLAPRAGFVDDVDAMAIARVASFLGAGRSRIEDAVDHAVGVSHLVQAGDPIESGAPLCRLHVNDETLLGEARELAQSAFKIGGTRPQMAPLVREEVA